MAWRAPFLGAQAARFVGQIEQVRMMLWSLGALALVVVVALAALQIAIWRNGPAVLDGVDRVTGGERGTKLLAKIKLGESPRKKLLVWGPTEPSRQAEPRPVILFVHGGSWRNGDPDDYGFVGRAFVPEGFIVVLAGYRLYPDSVYPAMLEDTARAIAWTRSEIAQYGGDPDKIVVTGHSAGANNVAMAALEDKWLENEGQSANGIAGVVGLSGPYVFYPFDSESTINSFGDATNPEATQPLVHVRKDAPPHLLIHARSMIW